MWDELGIERDMYLERAYRLGRFDSSKPLGLQLKLFDNTVLPILTYGSEVWGYENLDIIERIHTDFLRRITKCRKSTPRYILYAETGRYPIEITVKQRMINFWTRLITGKISKLSYNICVNRTKLISSG